MVGRLPQRERRCRELLKHEGTAARFGPYFQLHRLLRLRRRHGSLQRSERLRDCGSPDTGAEREKLLRFRASYKQHPIFLARL